MQTTRKRNPLAWLLLAIALVVAWQLWPARDAVPVPGATAPTATSPPTSPTAPPLAEAPSAPGPALPDFLPVEAHRTIALIQRGGPFPYRQDDGVFGNREGHLPRKPRGWYREYTVDTPGARTRGTRRIVTGGDPPEAWYYTDDHYESFRSFTVPAQGAQ